MLYRIFTENINKQGILKILNNYLDGFTLYKTDGYWRGQQEQSLVIERVSEKPNTMDVIRQIAREIKLLNKQQAVIVETIANHSEII